MTLAPVLCAVLDFTAWSSDGWQYEWLWGMRNPVSIVALLSPLFAAGVAIDMSRRWTPVAKVLGPSARRWRRASLSVPAVHVLWVFAGQCAVWAAAALRIALNDAITSPDPWLPFEALASLAAAAAVGLVVGTYVPDAAAPPVAAISVFATPAFASTLGLSGLFSPAGLSSSVVGLTRDPQAAALLIGLNLAVAALCCLLALRGPRPSLPWAAGAASLLAVVIALLAVPVPAYEFRPVGGPTVCAARADVRVCGPQAAELLIQNLSLGLQQASAGSPVCRSRRRTSSGSPVSSHRPMPDERSWSSPRPCSTARSASESRRHPVPTAGLPAAARRRPGHRSAARPPGAGPGLDPGRPASSKQVVPLRRRASQPRTTSC